MRVSFKARCFATLEETWEAEVPEGLEGDALADAVRHALEHGPSDWIADEASDEHDREIDADTIEILPPDPTVTYHRGEMDPNRITIRDPNRITIREERPT